MTHAQRYPDHCRTSCSDANPNNAEAGGSRGCARCTALLLDERDELREALRGLSAEMLTMADEMDGMANGCDSRHATPIPSYGTGFVSPPLRNWAMRLTALVRAAQDADGVQEVDRG